MKFRLVGLTEIKEILRELSVGLQRLTLYENFENMEIGVTIASGAIAKIRNTLTFIPSRYIIVSQEGDGLVTKDTTTPWDLNHVYLINNGSNEVTIKVIFMR